MRRIVCSGASETSDSPPSAPVVLSERDFQVAVASLPLVSIDFMIRDTDGRYLVGQRRNDPARGWWFVPGGRIRKNERMLDAIRRLWADEMGSVAWAADPVFRGVYEHFYSTDFTSQQERSTHYVVLAFEVKLAGLAGDLPQCQHHGYRWLAPEELLADELVHPYTKAYLR